MNQFFKSSPLKDGRFGLLRRVRNFVLTNCLLSTAYCLLPTVSFSQIIAGGGFHSLSVCSDSTAMAWGYGFYGQLGYGLNADKHIPNQMSGLTGVIAVAGGELHSLALRNDGTVWASGYNAYGQIGDSTTNDKYTPVQVRISGVKAIAGGQYHSLALKSDSTAWAWGYNAYGQLGDGTTGVAASKSFPVQVSGIAGIIAISCGESHSLALKKDGTVWTWGLNNYGQLGDSTIIKKSIPVQVHGPGNVGYLTGIIAIASGQNHSLALKNDSTVWAWGQNNFGTLGIGNIFSDKYTPVQVHGFGNVGFLTGITAIGAGGQHSLVLKNDNTVWACGFNLYGQLGDGSTTNRRSPVQVSGLMGITAIAGGGYFSLAMKDNGTAWAWGTNGYGQLGDSTIIQRKTPVQVIGLCSTTPTGTDETYQQNGISVFPNPSNGIFTIEIANGSTSTINHLALNPDIIGKPLTIDVYNMLGVKVYTTSTINHLALNPDIIGEPLTIDLSSHPGGVYFIQIKSNNRTVNQKLIIQK